MSDARIKAEPSCSLSAVIAPKPMVFVVPLISPIAPYILSTLHSERVYGMTSSGIAMPLEMPLEVVRTHHSNGLVLPPPLVPELKGMLISGNIIKM